MSIGSKNKFHSLTETSFQRRSRERPSMDKRLKDASKLYEKQFLRQMMKSMRGTVSKSDLVKNSMAEKIFSEQLDNEYVEQWGDKGGIGLSRLIYNQLRERFGPQLGLDNPLSKPEGPIPLHKEKTFIPLEKNKTDSSSTYHLQRLEGGGDSGPLTLVNPWEGTVKGSFHLPEGQTVIELAHGNGLTSQLVFKGELEVKRGELLPAGAVVGRLAGAEKGFYWKVKA